MTWKHVSAAALAAAVVGLGVALHAQAPAQPAAGAAADPVAAVKQSLQQGLAKARNYEWVETTIVSMKGEEKARKQNRCYYGADGKVQKVSLDQPAAAEKQQASGGRRGRLKTKVVENKKEDIQEYMEKAAALIHSYVPPDGEKIQAAKAAGRVKPEPQGPGKLRIAIADYLLPGDSLTIDLDTAANRLTGLGVSSYLEKKDEPVTLAVQMGSLADGALYAAQTTLDVKAKNIVVVIQNSGHRPVMK